jgi:hypothetical protein
MATPEVQPSAERSGVETAKAAGEQLEALEKKHEKSAEKGTSNQEQAKTEAKHNAMEQAISVEAGSAEREHKQPGQSTARRHGVVSKHEKEASFKKEMKRVQAELPAGSRAFSKIIHNKAIEKTSDAVGSTIARPDAILSGAVAAFILVLAVYIVAKTFGYVLSGFETIGAFVIGWILGIIYDYVKTLVTGRSS